MEQVSQQLLGLLWGALPTAVIVLFLYFFLRWSFWKPLERVLAEREAATRGARKAAHETLAQAADKVRQYEESLRQARAEIYRQQEAVRREALEERGRILRETRQQATEMVQQAKLALGEEIAEAKKQLDLESARLAEEIARVLLRAPAAAVRRPGGRRT